MTKTAHGNHLRIAVAMAMLTAMLMALTGPKPAEAALPEAAFPSGHDPIAFEKDGDIWVASKIHLANLTPNTPDSSETDPSVSPDGRKVTFASDRDGDFDIYTANVFTGEVARANDNAADDRKPAWSPDGQTIIYFTGHGD